MSKVHPNSLANLKKRHQGKVSATVTILPSTKELLESTGNKSKAIDVAIALLASDEKLWSELVFKVKEKL
jgi:hypothetical protein